MNAKISLINLNMNVLLRQRKGIQGALEEFEYLPINAARADDGKSIGGEAVEESVSKNDSNEESSRSKLKWRTRREEMVQVTPSEIAYHKNAKAHPGYQNKLRKSLKPWMMQ